MKIFKSIWLLLSCFASTVFAETPQLGLILVAPGQQGQMIETVMGESVHGESSSLSFIASYYSDIASENAQIAQAAAKAREEYERVLRETGIPPQPALPPSEQNRKDTAGQAIVDRTKTSLDLRRTQPFNIAARQENENKRLKAVQYYLTVSNTTNRILRTDFANMADKVLAQVNPNLSVEDRKVMLDIGAELLDFAVGISASVAVDTFQAITGKHYRTWENLDTADHLMSMGSVLTLGTAGAGIRGIKAIKRISEHLYGAGYAVLTRMPIFEKAASLAGEVRSSMFNVGEMLPGTTIPKYFSVNAGGEKFYVTANATEHMAEFITRRPPTHSFELKNDMLLASFYSAVKETVSSGAWKQSIDNASLVVVDGWELGFGIRGDGSLPAVKHALMRK